MHERSYALTKDYIFRHQTSRGAWTKMQIEALGLTWPPREGWIDRLEGTSISFSQCQDFETGKDKYAKTHKKRREKRRKR